MKASSVLGFWNSDPRFLQIFLLSGFLVYGNLYLGWSAHWRIFAAALISVQITQMAWCRVKHISFQSWKSALISGLGLCLLLKTNSWMVMSIAGILTISSKFIFRSKGKHLFNPTNFGIMALVLTGEAWISPGQWGQGETGVFLILLGASGILLRVKRWDVSAAFLTVLFILEGAYVVGFLGWEWDVLIHRFSSGTILLFAFFMITDPKTSPDSRRGRLIWGASVALLSFFLSRFFYLYESPLIALFIISLTTPLIDRLYRARRFQWT